MNTTLSNFLDTLFKKGQVLVAEQITPFTTQEKTAASLLLQVAHDRQQLSMPAHMPTFDKKAALWGTIFLYRAVQLTMMRDLDEAAVQEHLPNFSEGMTTEAIYSIDLTFRYLPDLFKLAKGLAPDDPLIKILKQQAQQFPFSSVGISSENIQNQTLILNHTSLKLAYLDRIIEKKDLERVKKGELFADLQEILGIHTFNLWPDLKKLQQLK